MTDAGRRGALPPRPRAIATFLASDDFLPGCQTLLHSLKEHLAPTPADGYRPEIVVLRSSRVGAPDAAARALRPIFCDRVVPVEHMPITRARDPRAGEDATSSHVRAWDDNCGWTKLCLFELDGYDKILYIDADCLVVGDVGHLLHIDRPAHPSADDGGGKCGKAMGLLAAAPDIFPPDKFNAGVMLLRPSKAVFDDMMTRLPNSSPQDAAAAAPLGSYDGGDTGFLNAFYPDWYREMPASARLPFGCNAQRFMHRCTHGKRPGYWDEAIADLRIIHFSSSPKPWEQPAGESGGETPERQSYLNKEDTDNIQAVANRGELESMWHAAYGRSQQYYTEQLARQSKIAKGSRAPRRQAPPPPPPPAGGPLPNAHRLVQQRYKELRKTMSTKDAMRAARAEYGLDKTDRNDPSQAVGRMFGLM